MRLIDTHAHMHHTGSRDQDFSGTFTHDDEIRSQVDRARSVGVEKIMNVATTLEDSPVACGVAEKFPHVFGSIGVHPHDAEKLTSDENQKLFTSFLTYHPRAIGEIGLDYFKMRNEKKDQHEAFLFQLDVAKSTKLPVLIHTRDAFDDTYHILLNAGVRGIIHSFTGTYEWAKKFIDLGFVVAFNGIMTFSNAKDLQGVVQKLSLHDIVLETDSPFLSPEPERGQQNEPAKVRFVAEKIATLKGVELEKVAEATSKNAEAILNI